MTSFPSSPQRSVATITTTLALQQQGQVQQFCIHQHSNSQKSTFSPSKRLVGGTDSSNRKISKARTTVLGATAASEGISEDGEDTQQQETYHWTSQNFDLAIPALVGMLADPLLSLMDTAYVGRVGAIELAALGACTSIFHLAFNAFRATTTATTSLVGNAERHEEKREIVQISLSLGISLGLVVMTTLKIAGPWCLGTMGIPRSSPLFQPASAYLSTRLWAAPVVLGIVVAEGAFRGYGDTKIPLLASMAASVINLVLDPILMFPLGMGVAGAAGATALSQVGAAGVYLYFLIKRRMLPQRGKDGKTNVSTVNKGNVIKSIMGANFAMVCKQGSLLLAWAYGTFSGCQSKCWYIFRIDLLTTNDLSNAHMI